MSLNSMLKKKYLYHGIEYIIQDIKPKGDGLSDVITDKKTIIIETSKIKKEFLPVASSKEDMIAVYKKFEAQSIQIDDLAKALMETIGKVQKDPQYIDQAQSINETARTLIEMKKTQIDALRLAKEIGG